SPGSGEPALVKGPARVGDTARGPADLRDGLPLARGGGWRAERGIRRAGPRVVNAAVQFAGLSALPMALPCRARAGRVSPAVQGLPVGPGCSLLRPRR